MFISSRMFALNSRMICCCAVTRSCPTLCDHRQCSMRGFPILHYIQELLRFMSIESAMLSNYLILCCPLLLLVSIFPSIRVFSNESALCIRWPKYCSFSFSTNPSNEYSGLTGLISLLSKGLSRVFSSTTVQKHQFFGAQPFLWSNFHIHT